MSFPCGSIEPAVAQSKEHTHIRGRGFCTSRAPSVVLAMAQVYDWSVLVGSFSVVRVFVHAQPIPQVRSNEPFQTKVPYMPKVRMQRKQLLAGKLQENNHMVQHSSIVPIGCTCTAVRTYNKIRMYVRTSPGLGHVQLVTAVINTPHLLLRSKPGFTRPTSRSRTPSSFRPSFRRSLLGGLASNRPFFQPQLRALA